MIRLSSRWTLGLKYLLPIAWLVFFTSFAAAVFLSSTQDGILSTERFRLSLIAFICFWLLLFYLSVFRLKRVDYDQDYLYVSNYIKTVKMPFGRIAGLREIDMTLGYWLKIDLIDKGHFGKTISVIASKSRYDSFVSHLALKVNADQ